MKLGEEAIVVYSEMAFKALTAYYEKLRPKICNSEFNQFMFPSSTNEGELSLSSLTNIMKNNKLPSGNLTDRI